MFDLPNRKDFERVTTDLNWLYRILKKFKNKLKPLPKESPSKQFISRMHDFGKVLKLLEVRIMRIKKKAINKPEDIDNLETALKNMKILYDLIKQAHVIVVNQKANPAELMKSIEDITPEGLVFKHT